MQAKDLSGPEPETCLDAKTVHSELGHVADADGHPVAPPRTGNDVQGLIESVTLRPLSEMQVYR